MYQLLGNKYLYNECRRYSSLSFFLKFSNYWICFICVSGFTNVICINFLMIDLCRNYETLLSQGHLEAGLYLYNKVG